MGCCCSRYRGSWSPPEFHAEEDKSPNPTPGSHSDWLRQALSSPSSSPVLVDEQVSQPRSTGSTTSSVSRIPMTDAQENVLRSLRENTVDLELYDTVESRLKYIAALMDNPQLLRFVGVFFFDRFQDRGELVDVETAIASQKRAVDLTPEGHADKIRYLNNLGNSFTVRFQRLGELGDIESAINAQQRADELTPDDHVNKAGILSNLGISLRSRFERLGYVTDINWAIDAQGRAVKLTPEGHPGKAKRLNNLGNSLQARFEYFGELVDIDRAISAQRQAAELSSETDKAGCLTNLGNSFQARFEHSGKLDDLDRAITAQQQAVELTPQDHPDKVACLNNLGNSFRNRFERLGSLVDIDSAITVQQRAVKLTPEGHADKAGYLNNLGNSFLARFEHLGQLADIESAVNAQQQAVEVTPTGHTDEAKHLSNLGNTSLRRFEHLGQPIDIESAIDAHQRAVELTPEDHADKASHLNNLANTFQARFESFGALLDIDNAISAQQRAVKLTAEDHADKAGYLSNLGNTFRTRFERLGDVVDIDSAVAAHQKAIQLTPQGHAKKAGRLNNVGCALLTRFQRLGELDDLVNAITAQQRAVELVPEDHAAKAAYLSNIGIAFRAGFKRLGEHNHINNAITAHQQAVDISPEGRADKAGYLNNLGNAFRDRFERSTSGVLVDVDSAISAHQRAVDLTPEGHADKASYLNNLGNSFLARFERSGELTDRDSAISALEKAANDISGLPSDRFSAASRWAQLLSSKYPTSSSLDAYRVVLKLIPRVIWLGSNIHRRYEELPSIAEIVNEAAATAITAGDLESALEWLEEGRCIVWGQMLQLRTPLDDLRAVDPKLADELQHVSCELENAGTRWLGRLDLGEADKQVSLEAEAQRHRRLAQEYERLVERARTLPECEDFLRPKRLVYLRGAANSGPVVVVNIDRQRCDALILHRSLDAVVHVCLPALNHGDVARWQESVLQSLKSSGVRDRGSRFSTAGGTMMSRILEALWLSVVQPVLLELKFTDQRARDDIPHITWCATGSLAFLPLHAAGIYDRPGEPKIYDYVVSSYTPTLAALLETGQHHRHVSIPSVLAVSQPATPGQNPLPGTVTEIAAVEGCVGNFGFCRLNGEQATKDAVLKAMAERSWIHLACHAEQHANEPTKSAFILHDGRLELVDIMEKSFKHTEFAVLSACQTATGDEKLPEEAVHLAAGMLMAGYPSVIATMWSIRDRDAPIVVKELYTQLVKGGGGDGRKVAYALHEAVKCLRDTVGESEFIRWVPFVHIGI